MTPDLDLSELPEHDLAPDRAELIRRRAHAALRAASGSAAPASRWSRSYQHVIEPLALLALGFTYLALVVGDTVAMLH